MIQSATIPIVVTPDATARVAELGMQAELDKLLEHAIPTVPGLRSIEVIREEEYGTGEEPGVTIQAVIAQPSGTAPAIEWEWSGWFVNSFSPDVCRHFCLLCRHEARNGR